MASGTHIPSTPEEAKALLEAYLTTRDEGVLADVISALKTEEDEGDFAIMSGSGNEVGTFVKALHLMKCSGLVTREDSIAFIRRT